MYSKIVIAALAAAVSVPASSQSEGPMPLPVQRADMAPQGNASLPANTEVLLQMTQEISTKGSNNFTFRIAGSYNPSDIPMERLGEYLVALGELLGEPASVHFDKLSAGSTVVHAQVEPAAMPKVERRVRLVAAGEGSKSSRKAFDRIDAMLRDDNATGHLAGGESNVIRVDFEGKNRPPELVYGPMIVGYGHGGSTLCREPIS